MLTKYREKFFFCQLSRHYLVVCPACVVLLKSPMSACMPLSPQSPSASPYQVLDAASTDFPSAVWTTPHLLWVFKTLFSKYLLLLSLLLKSFLFFCEHFNEVFKRQKKNNVCSVFPVASEAGPHYGCILCLWLVSWEPCF